MTGSPGGKCGGGEQGDSEAVTGGTGCPTFKWVDKNQGDTL